MAKRTTERTLDLAAALDGYKAFLASPEYDELYKWQIAKTVQDNWDLEAADLGSMIERSFSHKHQNLWAGAHYYPKAMLVEWATRDPEDARSALRDLLHGTAPLADRMRAFEERSNAHVRRARPGEELNTYQGMRATALWLGMVLPEQHYLYKATMATAYLERTGQAPLTRTGDKYTVIDEYYRRCEEARQMLLTRPDIIAAHQALRDASCHADPQHHLLVQDFLYYVSQAEPAAGARPVHYWLYAPGSNAEHWEAFRREGIMAMGWEDLGDYAQFGSVAEVADELRALFKTTSSKKNDANAIYDMAHNIAKGDVIIAKKGRSEYLGYGIVTGDHYFDPDRPFFRNCRKVEWVRHGSWPEEGSPIVLKTLTDITKYPAYVARLKELIGIDASGAEPLGMVMANITWNSLDWTAPSQDKSNHGYVKQGNTPMESWNFDLSNPRNPADKVLGFIQHTAPPKLFGNNNLVVFYSAGKVVGFYGKAQLLKDKPRASDGMEYNIIADRSLAVVLPNKLEDLKEKGYYEDKQKVGMNGFIYLKEKDTALAMIDEAIELNPTVGDRLRALRRWMTEGSTTTPGTTQKATMEQPLNSILYGPPGTGKTFYTVNQALGIIEDRSLSTIDQEDRGQLRERFTKYREEGRIEAVTFHQAISYEDFIEGIKPRLDDGEEEARDLGYVIQDGLFKRIAVRAAFEYVERDSSKAGAALAFGDRFDAYVAEVTERLEAEEQVVLPTRGGKKILVTGVSDRGNLLLKHENGDRTYTVSKARSEKLFNAFPDQTDVKNIYMDFRKVIGGSNASAYWAVLDQLHQRKRTHRTEPPRKVEYEEMVELVDKIDWKSDRVLAQRARPYVLVIDEINRGNVAGIFGELITLLEDDKRAGAREHIEAWLPYSKKPFVVPPNLHVIGTMNTADRNVEALDTALRRRFSFVECPSRPSELDKLDHHTVAGVRLSQLLTVINARIEMLLDRDHHIGHSYFMNWGNADKEQRLRQVFKNNIIPLLQEYFYGDPVKVGLVLGEAFVKRIDKTENGKVEFASGFRRELDIEPRTRYVFQDVMDPALVPMQAFKDICDGK